MIDEKRARRYCYEPEKIENYDKAVADKDHMWDCHHRLEIQGQFRNSVKLLKKCGMYWNQPAERLIFLLHDEHTRIHHKGKFMSEDAIQQLNSAREKRVFSEEWRKRISESKKGKSTWIKGRHHSEETRRKISETKKRRLAGVNNV